MELSLRGVRRRGNQCPKQDDLAIFPTPTLPALSLSAVMERVAENVPPAPEPHSSLTDSTQFVPSMSQGTRYYRRPSHR